MIESILITHMLSMAPVEDTAIALIAINSVRKLNYSVEIACCDLHSPHPARWSPEAF